MRYAFVMNRDTFLGRPPRSVLCCPILVEPVYFGTTRYYEKSYEFRVKTGKDATWNDLIPDMGFRQIVGGKQVDILDEKTQQPVTVPKFLNLAGVPLTQAQLIAAGPKYYEPRLVPVVNFAP